MLQFYFGQMVEIYIIFMKVNIFYLNNNIGGPGCSGLVGLFWELGPFRPNADKTLTFNRYSWNNIANIIFIESPVSVGFSYSTNPSDDYILNDSKTANDNYKIIQEFFIRFPEYKNNSFYLASESYGGHYLPTLAQIIADENYYQIYPYINFKGFLVGNPYTNIYSGTQAMYETLWGHQLISKPLWKRYEANCILKHDPVVSIFLS